MFQELIRNQIEQPHRFLHSADYINAAGSPGFAHNLMLLKT